MDTLKDSTDRFFNSVPEVKILQGVRMDSICPDLPIWSKIDDITKRADIQLI